MWVQGGACDGPSKPVNSPSWPEGPHEAELRRLALAGQWFGEFRRTAPVEGRFRGGTLRMRAGKKHRREPRDHEAQPGLLAAVLAAFDATQGFPGEGPHCEVCLGTRLVWGASGGLQPCPAMSCLGQPPATDPASCIDCDGSWVVASAEGGAAWFQVHTVVLT